MASTTLSEVLAGRYKGDIDSQCRKLDQFLSDVKAERGRLDERHFSTIQITREIFGALRFAVLHRTCCAIIGEPGSGKTAHAEAFVRLREGAFLVRPDQAFRDAQGVSSLICRAIPGLRRAGTLPFRRRVERIREYLQANQNTVLLVDEAQRLTRAALELVRDLHDTSDLSGVRFTPIAFFADPTFLRLVHDAREGREGSRIESQLSSRIAPIYVIGSGDGSSGGDIYTTADIVAILQAGRLKVIDPAGARWLRVLANVAFSYGRLRLALMVFRAARELARQNVVEVKHLQAALQMVQLSDQVRTTLDELSAGELLAKSA